MFWYTIWWDFENVSFTDEKYYACTAKNRDSGISTQRFYVLVVPKGKTEHWYILELASQEAKMLSNKLKSIFEAQTICFIAPLPTRFGHGNRCFPIRHVNCANAVCPKILAS